MVKPDVDAHVMRMRHSCAHILAQAVIERFSADGEVHLGTGPATDEGFWYDFSLPRKVTDDDLSWLQGRMRKIIASKVAFDRRVVSADEARTLFADQPFKLEIISGIVEGGLDAHGEKSPAGSDPTLTTYTQDTFEDLCAGPHVENSAELDPRGVKLLSVGGAYWQGDQTRPMLQRIYGTAFKTAADLADWEEFRREAAKRDHRKLGRELDMFMFEAHAPGMPYWLPNGLRVINTLFDFWRAEHDARGYQEISSPLINDKALWETSGHWANYAENMFIIPADEHTTYGVKPMNCPNAMVVFNRGNVSYRDLPMRLSDCDTLHRHERSGALHGLMRVQSFRQDDAHIFLPEADVEAEYERILDIADRFYDVFGLTYRLRLGTRPEKFVGEIESWDRAESILHDVLTRRVGANAYEVCEGDGAFYGPKIDILMEDAIGREWQMGTIQLDFQLPRRFGCRFTTSSGEEETPVVIHRVIYGSIERFVGILLEHTSGALPPWLSPRHVAVLPVSDQYDAAATAFAESARARGLRADVVPVAKGSIGARVRETHRTRTPYVIVFGAQEAEQGVCTPRLRSGESLPAPLPNEEFLDRVQRSVRELHVGTAEAFGDLLTV